MNFHASSASSQERMVVKKVLNSAYCLRMKDSSDFGVMGEYLGPVFDISITSPIITCFPLLFPTCPQEQWNHWLQQGISEATLRHQKFRPLHHAFRVIATGEPPTEERNWLEDELLTLFHFTEVEVLGCFLVCLWGYILVFVMFLP